MQQTNNEIELLVKLKYPNPLTHAVEFFDTLPDEFISEYLYPGKVYDVEEKRKCAKEFFRMFTNVRGEADRIIELLVDYHTKKDNTSA